MLEALMIEVTPYLAKTILGSTAVGVAWVFRQHNKLEGEVQAVRLEFAKEYVLKSDWSAFVQENNAFNRMLLERLDGLSRDIKQLLMNCANNSGQCKGGP